MTSVFSYFKGLHHQKEPLLLANVWDVQSARMFEKTGFKAIGTSSAAVAGSLGYEDGGGMPFADYLFMVRRIAAAVSIPLSVDVEWGYGDSAEEIAQNISELAACGVVGINIEDSVVADAVRTLQEATVFATKLRQIRDLLAAENVQTFMNVRCDTFLLDVPDKAKESEHRMRLYEAEGADGIFLPCIQAETDIKAMVKVTGLPLNVMCMPALPGFERLGHLGVRRISMGDFLFNYLYGTMEETVQKIRDIHNFSPLFAGQ